MFSRDKEYIILIVVVRGKKRNVISCRSKQICIIVRSRADKREGYLGTVENEICIFQSMEFCEAIIDDSGFRFSLLF